MTLQIPLPIVITREGKWFVASCAVLDIASQGRTEKEVKEDISDLINEYLRDKDTRKPSLSELMTLSLSNVPIKIPEGVLHRKTPATKSN
jgi:predicted RNase H-like HicB family nuclease